MRCLWLAHLICLAQHRVCNRPTSGAHANELCLTTACNPSQADEATQQQAGWTACSRSFHWAAARIPELKQNHSGRLDGPE